MLRRHTRRDFLKVSAAAGLGVWVSTRAIAQSSSPNEKLNIASVGVANRAGDNIEEVRISEHRGAGGCG